MDDNEPLFLQDDLDQQLRGRRMQVAQTVNQIPEDKFLASSTEELVEHVISRAEVEPLVLHDESATSHQSETQIDVTHDQSRVFGGRAGKVVIPGTRFTVEIPYSGEHWLFHYRTNPFSSMLPRARVDGRSVYITVALPHDADKSQFKTHYDRQFSLLKEFVSWSHAQVVQFNKALPAVARTAVEERKERLKKHGDIAEMIGIPMKKRDDAPSVKPVKVQVRRPKPLPAPPKSGLASEPGIDEQSFEQILRFIRHQGRTFERTPSTYSKHGEEDLRNIVLAQLNGHFEGLAGGEVFRGKGKTDICIEEGSRSAFVGECKLWSGPSALSDAVDQLLGYLTWRDSKAALIVFNTKNKEFSKIIETLPTTIKKHSLYLRDLPCDESGEWRVLMRSEEDEGRRVTVHVFAFNLFTA